MMWTTTGNLTNVRSNAKFAFGVAHAAGEGARRLADRRRQLLHLQERATEQQEGRGAEVHPAG